MSRTKSRYQSPEITIEHQILVAVRAKLTSEGLSSEYWRGYQNASELALGAMLMYQRQQDKK